MVHKLSEMSGKDRQQEIWRRILNNLPYLLKTKGTKRAIHAAMSCYGVPASLLTIMEFGGPKDVSSESATMILHLKIELVQLILVVVLLL